MHNIIHRSVTPALLLTISLILGVTTAKGQLSQTARYEREHKNSQETYTIISLEEKGLLLLRQKNKYNGNKKQWEVIALDTALQEKGTSEFYLEERYPMIGYEITDQNFYLLFRTGESSRNNLLLIDFDLHDLKELERHEIKPELDFKITHFSKVGNSMVLGGYVSNDPAILLYDLKSKGMKVVPGFFIKDNELVDLRVNQNQTFNVVIIDRSNRSDRKIVFRTFDETGKMLLEDITPIDDNKSLQHCISSTLDREELMVMGTWGERQGKQSNGFFALPVNPFEEQNIRYFNFGSLEHFVDYLNPKRAAKIKAKAKDEVQAGRRPSFSAYVMPYKVLENENGFVMIAEMYDAVATQNSYYNSPYGNPYYANPYFYSPMWFGYYPGMRYRPYPYWQPQKNQELIKILGTAVICFDGKGNVVWDHSMKLEDMQKPSLDQVSDFYYDGKIITFLAQKEGELKSRRIVIDSGESSENSVKIKLSNPEDEFRHEKEDDNGVRHWTGNSFYVWGYETLRNVGFKDDRLRDVFFINKVVAH